MDSTVTTAKTGTVTVAANDSATILGISAGAAISTGESSGFNLTGLGSLTVNLIGDHATATVGDAGGAQYGTSISTGSLSVTASNAAITDAFAGNVDISTSEEFGRVRRGRSLSPRTNRRPPPCWSTAN